MKVTRRIFSLIAVFAGLLLYSSCNKNETPQPSTEEVQMGKLAKTWKIDIVTLDGVTKTTDYANFQLTLSGTATSPPYAYTTTGRPALSPWLSSGTWVFGDNAETQIIRDKGTADELATTYSVSDTKLQITFTFSGSGYPGGRVANVQGNWIYTFKL